VFFPSHRSTRSKAGGLTLRPQHKPLPRRSGHATTPGTRTSPRAAPASSLEGTRCCGRHEAIRRSNPLELLHLAVLQGLWLSGGAASPFPPFWELARPKSDVCAQTRSLSLLKKTKIIPSLLSFTLPGNAPPQATLTTSVSSQLSPEEMCGGFEAGHLSAQNSLN